MVLPSEVDQVTPLAILMFRYAAMWIICIGLLLCWLGTRDASYDIAAVCGILGVCMVCFDAGFTKLGCFLSSGLFSLQSCLEAAIIDSVVGVVLLYSAGSAVRQLRAPAVPAAREKPKGRPKSPAKETSAPKATAPQRRSSPRRGRAPR